MEEIALVSSNLRRAAYKASELVLEIEFKSGAVYAYQGVPGEVFEELKLAPSAGKFFIDQIRDNYSTSRIK